MPNISINKFLFALLYPQIAKTTYFGQIKENQPQCPCWTLKIRKTSRGKKKKKKSRKAYLLFATSPSIQQKIK